MTASSLRIDAVNLHQLTREAPDTDLCAHGGLRVSRGDAVFVDVPQAPYAVSTAALHLLSTIERDHVSPDPRADHLVPCCGHFMEIDAATDEVLNLGCPNGVDWSVRHPRVDQVALSFVGGEELSVHLREWRDAVVAFSSAVRAFYFGEAPKRPGDDYEAAWHARFLAEWERRHQQALTKQPGT